MSAVFDRLDFVNGHVDLAMGSGGRASALLIEQLFYPAFDNPILRQGNDQAVVLGGGGRMALSTDCHVVSPLFFPGGDIGSLAVHGTVNDLAMGGAQPLFLTLGFVIEEGLPLADLRRIVLSIASAAHDASVQVVGGDTKVVERGHADGLFVTSTGLGVVPEGVVLSGDAARVGDVVLVSGSMGDHGMAVLSQRHGLAFSSPIVSDSAPLHNIASSLISACPSLRLMRDPTRGGLATTLNELAQQSGVGMVLDEAAIPVSASVRAACEALGIDPLYVANEGKLVAVCGPEDAERALETLRAHPLGRQAAQIGEVVADPHRFVRLRSSFGGVRLLDWLFSDQLPRIC